MLGFVVLIENCGHKWGINNEPETNEYLQTRDNKYFCWFYLYKKVPVPNKNSFSLKTGTVKKNVKAGIIFLNDQFM